MLAPPPFVREAIARREARAVAVEALLASGPPRPLYFPPGSVAGPDASRWVLVHRSPSRPGWWQASRFDARRVLGHLDGEDWGALLLRLARDHFVQLSAARDPDG